MKQYDTRSSDRIELRAETGQVVAHIATDAFGRRRIEKSVSASKHMLRTPPAYAFDSRILSEGRSLGAQYARLFEREAKRTYFASLEDFDQHGFDVRRGFGPQRALGLAFWSSEEPPPGLPGVGVVVTPESTSAGEQPSLFMVFDHEEAA